MNFVVEFVCVYSLYSQHRVMLGTQLAKWVSLGW